MADGFIERISLCRVSRTKDKDDKTTLWLMRLADVESKYDEDVQPLEIIRIPSADSGRFVLKDSVYNLPLYSFSPDDTITIDGKIFYMSLECGEHLRMELMKNPMEIVRGVILQRILPAKVKALNLLEITKASGKRFALSLRDFQLILYIMRFNPHVFAVKMKPVITSAAFFTDRKIYR